MRCYISCHMIFPRMAVFDISLVTLWVLATLASITGGSFCNDGWSYHNLSGSCLKIFTETARYWNKADSRCGEFKTNRGIGHLVYIFDRGTDDFVKDLLKQENVASALIGLHDQILTGRYMWGDTRMPLGQYTGWKGGTTPAGDSNRRSVIISEHGWEKYDGNREHDHFICQVDAEFPLPEIKCPVAEEGEESPSIDCTFPATDEVRFKGLWFESGGRDVIYCNSTTCRQSKLYEALINDQQMTRSNLYIILSSLKIKKVQINDGTTWRCKVELENVPVALADQCNMKVYSPPEQPTCNHEFTTSSVVVNCTTRRVYPQAACQWYINRVAVNQSPWADMKSYHASVGTYYRTDCVLTYKPHHAGRYKFDVLMFPDITEPGFYRQRAARNESVIVDIETPQKSPEFVIQQQTGQNLTLYRQENQTIDIMCLVIGGSPPVYQTKITCPGGVSRSALGSNVTVNIRLTRNMNYQFCYCNADHIVPYSLTASLQLNVSFPPQITTFEANNKKDGPVEINSGEIMTLKCSAEGNPAPNVTLYREHGGNIKSTYLHSSVTTVTHLTTAGCRNTGTYQCRARNSYNPYSSDTTYINVRVRCPPEHCDSRTTNRTFGVAVNTNITVKICVLAYTKPKHFTLYRGKNPMSRETYRANFHYTHQAQAEGEVILNIYSFKQQDLGAYTLKSDNKEFPDPGLQFHLIKEGPADCPTEFVVENVTTNSLILSWGPGFDGGRPQTFVILGQNVTSLARTDYVILEKVNHSDEPRLSYNVTGLSASTFYEFGVYVDNGLNITMCPELQANGTTQGFPRAGSSLTNIVVAVVVILCLIVLVIIAVIFVLRRQTRSCKTDLGDKPYMNSAHNLNPISPQTEYENCLLPAAICDGHRNVTTLDPSDRNMHIQTTSEQTAMICGNTTLMEHIEKEEVQYETID